MLGLSAVFFATYRTQLASKVGPRRLAEVEDTLEEIGAPIGDYLRGFPGWLA